MNEEMKKFEQALAELEALVKKLENDMPIDEATKAFEQGVSLSKTCLKDLTAEKGKLGELVDDLNNITKNIDAE